MSLFPLRHPPKNLSFGDITGDPTLDQHLAELLVKENKRSKVLGFEFDPDDFMESIRSLLQKDRTHKPNLRFLRNMLRNTLSTNRRLAGEQTSPPSRKRRSEKRRRDSSGIRVRGRGRLGAQMDHDDDDDGNNDDTPNKNHHDTLEKKDTSRRRSGKKRRREKERDRQEDHKSRRRHHKQKKREKRLVWVEKTPVTFTDLPSPPSEGEEEIRET